MASSVSPKRILIIRPSALGDVCRTVPVLATLRRAWPEARIDWLVQDSFAAAVEHHPDLSGVVAFPRRRFHAWWNPPVGAKVLGWLRELKRARYDLVLDCQGLARSGLFMLATGAARRIGYAQAAEGAWLGANERIDVPRDMHTVERMLRLAAAAIAGVEGARVVRDMRLFAPARDLEQVQADEELGGRYAVLAPTARWEGKRWPAERFAHAAEALLADSRAAIERVVVAGGAGERDQCGPLFELAEREPRVIDRIGATTVGGLMALIARSSLVIANDSAALHMAVGFRRPYVGLFGPTRRDLVGPFPGDGPDADRGVVLQHLREGDVIDHKHPTAGAAIMERISVDEVVASAIEVASSSAGTPISHVEIPDTAAATDGVHGTRSRAQ